MTREQPPQGCQLYAPGASPNAHALVVHDLKEQRSPAIDLLAQALNNLGVQLLSCSLRHMLQPINTQGLQAIYQWLEDHYYKPQIAIGVGLGAHLQRLLDWPQGWAMVHIDAPDPQLFAAASSNDLFNSPHVAVADGSVQVEPATAAAVVETTATSPTMAQLWLGGVDQLARLALPADVSRLHTPQSLEETGGLVHARLISAWILGQLPSGGEQKTNQIKPLPDGQHQVQACMRDNEQIELRTGELTLASSAGPDASISLLLLALAHASLLELRETIQRLGWEMPRMQINLRSAATLAPTHTTGQTSGQTPIQTNGQTGEQSADARRLCHIREIHILEGMDEVRKNLLHQQLSDSISLAGLNIPLINRLR